MYPSVGVRLKSCCPNQSERLVSYLMAIKKNLDSRFTEFERGQATKKGKLPGDGPFSAIVVDLLLSDPMRFFWRRVSLMDKR